jgi:hypothetical protein
MINVDENKVVIIFKRSKVEQYLRTCTSVFINDKHPDAIYKKEMFMRRVLILFKRKKVKSIYIDTYITMNIFVD